MEEESEESRIVAVDVAAVVGERRPTVADLPPEAVRVDVGRLYALRRGSFVYFLFAGDECVYIGETTALAGRLLSHAKSKSYDSAHFLAVADGARKTSERYWIRRLLPRMNRQLYPVRRVRRQAGVGRSKNITMPPDWWEAFTRAALKAGQSLSEWMGDNLRECLPASERRKLSDRTGRGRPPIREE